MNSMESKLLYIKFEGMNELCVSIPGVQMSPNYFVLNLLGRSELCVSLVEILGIPWRQNTFVLICRGEGTLRFAVGIQGIPWSLNYFILHLQERNELCVSLLGIP